MARPAAFQGIVIWLGEATIPVDLIGRPIIPKRLPQYVVQTLPEVETFLKSHGIRFIFIRETVWKNKLENIVKSVQALSSETHLVVLWNTLHGFQLSLLLGIEAVEDDPLQLLRFVQRSLELRYSTMSADKARLTERIAYRVAANLEQLIFDSSSKTARRIISENLQKVYLQYGDGDDAAERHLHFFRSGLGDLVPEVMSNSQSSAAFLRNLIVDVQDSYWVEVKSQLIENKKCDYGNWGIFLLKSTSEGVAVALSDAVALMQFDAIIGEIHSEPSFAEVLMWIADNLDKPSAPEMNSDPLAMFQSVAISFVRCNLTAVINRCQLVSRMLDPRFRSQPTGLGLWKGFGLQARALSFLGCLGFIYGLSCVLATHRTIEFLPNGKFIHDQSNIVFRPSEFFLDLLAANIPKSMVVRRGQ